VSAIFLIHGLVVATWVSRIPEIQTRLALTPAALGLTLLAAAVGSLVSMPLTGWLIDRRGSGRTTLFGSVAFCLALPLLALAHSAIWLAAALFGFGAAAGAMDVSMNAQAVAVEEQYGRSVMSSFHAMFSVGGMAGAAMGGWAAANRIAPLAHFLIAAAALFALTWIFAATGLIPDNDHHTKRTKLVLSRIPARVFGLAAIAFAFFLTEGAVADWSAIYLREFLGAGPGTAAMGYAVFSVVMAIGRFGGDAIIERLGRERTLRIFSAVAASGLALAVAAPVTTIALVGFGLVGAGCSVIVPVTFAASGRIAQLSKGAGMAVVSGGGYLGLLAGPPLIGFTAQAITLRNALILVTAFSATGIVLARSSRSKASE
jgi:MFS family permease